MGRRVCDGRIVKHDGVRASRSSSRLNLIARDRSRALTDDWWTQRGYATGSSRVQAPRFAPGRGAQSAAQQPSGRWYLPWLSPTGSSTAARRRSAAWAPASRVGQGTPAPTPHRSDQPPRRPFRRGYPRLAPTREAHFDASHLPNTYPVCRIRNAGVQGSCKRCSLEDGRPGTTNHVPFSPRWSLPSPKVRFRGSRL